MEQSSAIVLNGVQVKISPWRRYINLIRDMMKSRGSVLLSRGDAYARTKNVKCMNIEDYIERERRRIVEEINDKCFSNHYGYDVNDFMVMESFSKDMEPYVDDILNPIREAGYTVINLKDRVPELAESNYYLILWNTL